MSNELEFKQAGLFENLTEQEKSGLLADCSVMFTNKSFKKVSDEMYTRAVMKTIQGTKEEFDSNQGIAIGIQEAFSTIAQYHTEYLASKEKDEPYDKSDII